MRNDRPSPFSLLQVGRAIVLGDLQGQDILQSRIMVVLAVGTGGNCFDIH